MGLFSTLASSSAVPASETSSASSLKLPTVVQLYATASTKPLCLLDDETAAANKSQPGYAAWTYQAVPVTVDTVVTTTVGLRAKKDASMVVVPELGVWNCGVTPRSSSNSSSAPLVDQLLPIATGCNTFCFTVDLSKPSLVEPSLTLLQDAVVRYLIARKSNNYKPVDATFETATTTLYQLRSVQFGLAPDDTPTSTTAAPDESDRLVKIALQIVVQLPPSATDTDYSAQQAQALLLYHLRKYAAALNASLAFVERPNALLTDTSERAAESTEEGQQPTMSIHELKSVWRNLALGQAVWKEENEPATMVEDDAEPTKTEEKEETSITKTTKIYGPGTYQTDLMESVLLRNAQYPGHWDASKDSVWKALPAESSMAASKTTKATTTTNAGDEAWLTELRNSVATAASEGARTPPRSANKPTTTASSAQKTPNEAADFFQSLLKK